MFECTGPTIVLNRQVRALPSGATAIAPSAAARGTIDEFVRIAERDGAVLINMGATHGGQAAAIREGPDDPQREFPGAGPDDPFFKMFKHSSLAPPRAFPKARVAPAYREESGLIMSPKAAIRVGDVLVGVDGSPAESPFQVRELIKRSGKSGALLRERGGDKIDVPVRRG